MASLQSYGSASSPLPLAQSQARSDANRTYSTCSHLKRDIIRSAIKICQMKSPQYVNVKSPNSSSTAGDITIDTADWMACTRCDRRSSVMDNEFISHFISSRHNVAVRLHAPIELYCVLCKDFQYHSDFDKRAGKKRHHKWGEQSADPSAVMSPADTYGVQGIINMGNTCFLSSVMQLLMHNKILQRYYNSEGLRQHIPSSTADSCMACSIFHIFMDKGAVAG
jgi:uncharacterized UBP type Zn finger protein